MQEREGRKTGENQYGRMEYIAIEILMTEGPGFVLGLKELLEDSLRL